MERWKINKEILKNLKSNKNKILEWKSTITEMENLLEGFKGKFKQAKKESINFKRG